MKGSNVRPQPYNGIATGPMARIVRDSADSTLDSFIPLTEAQKLFGEGKLYSIDIGPSYPNSYRKTGKE